MTQFWLITYKAGSVSMKTTETLLAHFWVIAYITGKLNFYEKNTNFIGLVLFNNLSN